MDYLQKEFDKYKQGRQENKSFEETFPLKAHAFRSLYNQVGKNFSQDKLLEVGCGSGYFLSQLAKNNSTVGVDTNSTALEYANEIFNEKNVKGKFMKENGFDLPFGKNSFDLVFNIGVLEHFDYDNQMKFLKNMADTSKNHVLISTPNNNEGSLYQNFKKKSSNYMPEEENLYDLEKMAKEAGLNPLKKGGFHIISREDMCNENLKNIYQNKGFKPKEGYEAKDLGELLKFENSLTDEELYNNSFLKYVLAEKR